MRYVYLLLASVFVLILLFDRMNPYVAYNHNSIDKIILLYIVAFFYWISNPLLLSPICIIVQ